MRQMHGDMIGQAGPPMGVGRSSGLSSPPQQMSPVNAPLYNGIISDESIGRDQDFVHNGAPPNISINGPPSSGETEVKPPSAEPVLFHDGYAEQQNMFELTSNTTNDSPRDEEVSDLNTNYTTIRSDSNENNTEPASSHDGSAKESVHNTRHNKSGLNFTEPFNALGHLYELLIERNFSTHVINQSIYDSYIVILELIIISTDNADIQNAVSIELLLSPIFQKVIQDMLGLNMSELLSSFNPSEKSTDPDHEVSSETLAFSNQNHDQYAHQERFLLPPDLPVEIPMTIKPSEEAQKNDGLNTSRTTIRSDSNNETNTEISSSGDGFEIDVASIDQSTLIIPPIFSNNHKQTQYQDVAVNSRSSIDDENGDDDDDVDDGTSTAGQVIYGPLFHQGHNFLPLADELLDSLTTTKAPEEAPEEVAYDEIDTSRTSVSSDGNDNVSSEMIGSLLGNQMHGAVESVGGLSSTIPGSPRGLSSYLNNDGVAKTEKSAVITEKAAKTDSVTPFNNSVTSELRSSVESSETTPNGQIPASHFNTNNVESRIDPDDPKQMESTTWTGKIEMIADSVVKTDRASYFTTSPKTKTKIARKTTGFQTIVRTVALHSVNPKVTSTTSGKSTSADTVPKIHSNGPVETTNQLLSERINDVPDSLTFLTVNKISVNKEAGNSHHKSSYDVGKNKKDEQIQLLIILVSFFAGMICVAFLFYIAKRSRRNLYRVSSDIAVQKSKTDLKDIDLII